MQLLLALVLACVALVAEKLFLPSPAPVDSDTPDWNTQENSAHYFFSVSPRKVGAIRCRRPQGFKLSSVRPEEEEKKSFVPRRSSASTFPWSITQTHLNFGRTEGRRDEGTGHGEEREGESGLPKALPRILSLDFSFFVFSGLFLVFFLLPLLSLFPILPLDPSVVSYEDINCPCKEYNITFLISDAESIYK